MDPSTLTTAQQALLGAGAGAAALGALWRWGVRPVTRTIRQLRQFLADWAGEPERPGVPARMGVMERLERIEWHVGNGDPRPLRQAVEHLESELQEIKEGRQ